MRRPKAAVPAALSFRCRARLRLCGRTFFLGPYGSADARRLEDQIIAVYLANGRTLPADFDPAGDQSTTATLRHNHRRQHPRP